MPDEEEPLLPQVVQVDYNVSKQRVRKAAREIKNNSLYSGSVSQRPPKD